MNWEQLKSELQEAAEKNITATMSPHTVLAIMQQVEDQQSLIKNLDRAVLRWTSTSSKEDSWPGLLNDLMEIQEQIRTLFGEK